MHSWCKVCFSDRQLSAFSAFAMWSGWTVMMMMNCTMKFETCSTLASSSTVCKASNPCPLPSKAIMYCNADQCIARLHYHFTRLYNNNSSTPLPVTTTTEYSPNDTDLAYHYLATRQCTPCAEQSLKMAMRRNVTCAECSCCKA